MENKSVVSTEEFFGTGEPSTNLVSTDEFFGKSVQSGNQAQKGFSIEQTIKNIPRSGGEFLKNVVSPIVHPIDTGKAISKLALGTAQKLIPGQQKSEASFDALTNFFKERYGGVENVKKTIQEDPVGFLGDLSTVLTGGGGLAAKTGQLSKVSSLAKAGQAVSKAGTAIEPLGLMGKVAKGGAQLGGEVTSAGLGLLSGSQYKNMRESLFNPNKTFRDFMKGKRTQDDIVVAAEKGLQTLKDERATNYQGQLQKVSANKKQIDLTPIRAEFQNQLQKFNVKQVVGQDGKITYDFSRSPINKAATKDIEEIANEIDGWGTQVGDDTAAGLDILKRRLDDFYTDSGQARSLVSNMRNKVKSTIVKEVKEYEKLVSDYEKASDHLKDIKSAFSLSGKSGSDTIIRKLTQTLRQNFEFRNKLAKDLQLASGEDLVSMIAGNQLNTWEPRGLAKLGAYGAGGAGVYAASAGALNPLFLGGLVLSSPRLMGEFLSVLGLSGQAIGKTMNAVYNPKLAQAGFQAGRAKEKSK
jgi:hypothetical protein